MLAEETQTLLLALPGAQQKQGEAVHELRVCCKHLRALLKLLPPGAAREAAEGHVTATAGSCGRARDARVVVELALRLAAAADGPGQHSAVMRWLHANLEAAEQAADNGQSAAAAALAASLDAAVLVPAAFDRSQVCTALAKTRATVGEAAAQARATLTPHDLHRLRSRAKRWMLQLKLCEELDCAIATTPWKAWQEPVEWLGHANDANVLLELLAAAPAELQNKSSCRRLCALADSYRRDVSARALLACEALLSG